MLTVGDKFPEFKLIASSDISFEKLNMNNAFLTIDNKTYKEKWLVIFFYPKDFTFICPTEIVAFSNMKAQFLERNAQILGCSVDSEFVHWAWRKYHKPLNHLAFPLLSDIKRELCSSLGIINSESGVAKRAMFIVDLEGIIRFSMATDTSVGRNPEEALRVLEALQTGELCPCGWTREQNTIDVSTLDI